MILAGVNFVWMYFTDISVRLTNLEQSHDTDITTLDETITTLQISMSDFEDTVDAVEDTMTALETENDEIQQRLAVLEDTMIGMFIYPILCSCGCMQ